VGRMKKKRRKEKKKIKGEKVKRGEVKKPGENGVKIPTTFKGAGQRAVVFNKRGRCRKEKRVIESKNVRKGTGAVQCAVVRRNRVLRAFFQKIFFSKGDFW